jgi:hypothetical protein
MYLMLKLISMPSEVVIFISNSFQGKVDRAGTHLSPKGR